MTLDVGVIGAGMIGQDPRYRAIKQVLTSGEIGAPPVVVHAAPSNPAVPEHDTWPEPGIRAELP